MKFQPPASVEFKAPPLILDGDLFDRGCPPPLLPSSLVGVVIPPTNAFGEWPRRRIGAPRRRKVMVLREMAIEGRLINPFYTGARGRAASRLPIYLVRRVCECSGDSLRLKQAR